jgi:hypothetical protein
VAEREATGGVFFFLPTKAIGDSKDEGFEEHSGSFWRVTAGSPGTYHARLLHVFYCLFYHVSY